MIAFLDKNRFVATIISILIFTLSFSSFNNHVSANTLNDSNAAITYNVYNCVNGNHYMSYTLNPVSTPPISNSRSGGVIGTDDRTPDYSKSSVVKLVSNENLVGTGFIVDAHTIATAAHCVFPDTNRSASNSNNPVTKIRIFNSDGTVAKTVTGLSEIHIPQNHVNAVINSNGLYFSRQYDYALIKVTENLEDYCCFNFGVALDNLPDNTLNVSITGFPSYLNNNTNNIVNNYNIDTMLTASGVITDTSSKYLNCNVDISPGNSGGPMYITTNFQNKTYYTVIGIIVQSFNASVESESYNTAIRFTTELLHFYFNNPNA